LRASSVPRPNPRRWPGEDLVSYKIRMHRKMQAATHRVGRMSLTHRLGGTKSPRSDQHPPRNPRPTAMRAATSPGWGMPEFQHRHDAPKPCPADTPFTSSSETATDLQAAFLARSATPPTSGPGGHCSPPSGVTCAWPSALACRWALLIPGRPTTSPNKNIQPTRDVK